MDFFLKYNIPKSTIELNYKSSIFLLGSCFAENIGNNLQNHKFNTLINPFGILFHPLAIERILNEILNNSLIEEKDVIFYNEQYLSLHSHSSLNKSNLSDYLNNYNLKLKESYLFLKNSSHVVITLGTSWVYKYLKTNEIVANCQKLPQVEFEKKILTINEIKSSLENIIKVLKEFNPNLKVIFTISPVRHIKDGFMENTLSKSHLIAALYEIVSKNETTTIFPAYEIMLDELRDYRFYKEDYLHPNNQAIEYIWEKFIHTYCTEETKNSIKKVNQINKDLLHKPFNPDSENHQLFLNNLKEKIYNFVKENPTVKF